MRSLWVVAVAAVWLAAAVTMTEASAPALHGYAEISAPKAVELMDFSSSLHACTSKCSLEVYCKGVKYVDGHKASKGHCTLLGAASARDGVKAIEAAAKAQEEQAQTAAKAKVAALKELQIKSATREKDVKKVEKEAPEKEVHIILNPVNQKPVPPELSPYGETLEEAELKATRMIKQINDMKTDKHKIKPVLEQKLIREVAEAAKEANVCEFAKQLHDKYVTRVEHEVELDEEETPGNSVKLLRQETKRANRIVKRRARREARREIRMNGMKIEAKVRQMLSQKDGQQKAQTFLKELQNKHCAPAEYAIKEAEVPKIKDVDSWSNCFKQKSNCKISDDVRTNCAKTCKEHAAVDKHRG